MFDRDLMETNADLAALFRAQLGIRRGSTLRQKLRHAGYLVPRGERAAGRRLVEAERYWANPKLRRRLDAAALAKDEARLRRWLDSLDPADRRKGLVLGILATIAFNLLVIAGLLIAWFLYIGWI